MAANRIPDDAETVGVKVFVKDPRGGGGETFLTLAQFVELFEIKRSGNGFDYVLVPRAGRSGRPAP